MKVELTMLTPGVLSKAIIDYDSLPIKGCFRLSTKDLIKVCKEIRTKDTYLGPYRPQQGSSPRVDHSKAFLCTTCG